MRQSATAWCDRHPVIDPGRAMLFSTPWSCAATIRGMKSMHLGSLTARSSPAGQSMWRRAQRELHACGAKSARGARVFGGRVFVAYSGHYGDCGDYHGTVVGVSQSDPSEARVLDTGARWRDLGTRRVTGDGKSLFVATGKTPPQRLERWRAVLRFGPNLARPTDTRDYFAPSNWKWLDSGDLDLGGGAHSD